MADAAAAATHEKIQRLRRKLKEIVDDNQELRRDLTKTREEMAEFTTDFELLRQLVDSMDQTHYQNTIHPDEISAMYEAKCEGVVMLATKSPRSTKEYETTGFVIYSGEIKTLILSCSHNLEATGLYDRDKDKPEVVYNEVRVRIKTDGGPKYRGRVCYLDFSKDLTLTMVKHQTPFIPLSFAEQDTITPGSFIWSISHPECYDKAEAYAFSSGTFCNHCKPILGLSHDCSCMMYNLPMNPGSSGAPIMNRLGEVIAVHISLDLSFAFGTGLRSIQQFLVRYFNSPEDLVEASTNAVIAEAAQRIGF